GSEGVLDEAEGMISIGAISPNYQMPCEQCEFELLAHLIPQAQRVLLEARGFGDVQSFEIGNNLVTMNVRGNRREAIERLCNQPQRAAGIPTGTQYSAVVD
ncbi:MAG: hypothetical protein PHZ00_03980, partial [Candidatus Peribacteraceae bacterium]|nr:hypothetical protein [Candidatus Peribacteraceae bacterium]